jgi:hypothetical protein
MMSALTPIADQQADINNRQLCADFVAKVG